MTIYIAVCDDNVADRKQLERQLEREKDARLKNNNEVLYIDSFGSEDALMTTPIKYDIFFIDITDGVSNGMDIAKKLRKNGIGAPIVLCTSKIDYSSYANIPKDLIILNKTLNKGQISHLIDVALEWCKNKIPLLEIRCQSDTHFVPYTDLIKVTPKGKGEVIATTIDESFTVPISIDRFYSLCSPYNCYIFCKNQIINLYHVKSAFKNGFVLSNSEKVTYTMFQKDKILWSMAEFIPTLRDK